MFRAPIASSYENDYFLLPFGAFKKHLNLGNTHWLFGEHNRVIYVGIISLVSCPIYKNLGIRTPRFAHLRNLEWRERSCVVRSEHAM